MMEGQESWLGQCKNKQQNLDREPHEIAIAPLPFQICYLFSYGAAVSQCGIHWKVHHRNWDTKFSQMTQLPIHLTIHFNNRLACAFLTLMSQRAQMYCKTEFQPCKTEFQPCKTEFQPCIFHIELGYGQEQSIISATIAIILWRHRFLLKTYHVLHNGFAIRAIHPVLMSEDGRIVDTLSERQIC